MKQTLNQHYAAPAYTLYFEAVALHIAIIDLIKTDPQPIPPGKAMTPLTARLLRHTRILDEAYGAAEDYITSLGTEAAKSITQQHVWFQAYSQTLSDQTLKRQQKIEEDRATMLSMMREVTDAHAEHSSIHSISPPPLPIEHLPALHSPMIEDVPEPAPAPKPKRYASLTQEEKWNNGFMRAVSPIESAPDSLRSQSPSHQDRLRQSSPAAYYGR